MRIKSIISCLLLAVVFVNNSIQAHTFDLNGEPNETFELKRNNTKEVVDDRDTLKYEYLPAAHKSIPLIAKSQLKETYQIDVLLPMDLNSLDEQNIKSHTKLPNNVRNLIYYIEGMQLAIDTLGKLEVPVELYIHDAPNLNYDLKYNRALKEHLGKSDALIAHTSSNELPNLSDFSLENNIMLLSTFSPGSGDIKMQPYFYLFNPKINTHIEALVSYGQKTFTQSPKFFIYDTISELSTDSYHKFIETISVETSDQFNWKHFETQENILNNLIPNRKNIIYCNSMDKEIVEEILAFLREIPTDYEIVVMGMPNWKFFINDKKLSHIHFYTTQPFYYDGQGGLSEWMKKEYKKKHGRNPHEMTFRGFELIYGLAQAFEKNGNQINTLLTQSHHLWPLSEFKFEAKFDDNDDFLYFENSYLYILHHFRENQEIKR